MSDASSSGDSGGSGVTGKAGSGAAPEGGGSSHRGATSPAAREGPSPGGARTLKVVLFASASFVGAFLLFVVQPMMGRAVLPLLGGSPATWSTSLFFFQAALLAGYLYAHLGLRSLGPRRMIPLHLALVALGALTLPATVPEGWTPPPAGSPALWLLGLLAVAIGAPFVLVSTTAPLVQRWFAASGAPTRGAAASGNRGSSARSGDGGEPASDDPYFLYAASNLGSLGALLAYPFLVQPALGVEAQTRGWSIGFGVWAVLVAGCGAWLWRWRREDAATSSGAGPTEEGTGDVEPRAAAAGGKAAPERSPGTGSGGDAALEADDAGGRGTFRAPTDPSGVARTRIRWVVLAFAPSSLLLGVTTHLSTDVAAAPLLWVVPLALYLLSFVVAFSRNPVLGHRRALRWQPLLVIPLVVAWFWSIGIPTVTEVALHLAGFFVTALVCHGELVRLRPRAEDLSDFYLWIAAGGALGGFFNSIAAPQLFDSSLEYPLVLVLSLLLRPGRRLGGKGPWPWVRDLAVPVALGAAGLAVLWAEAHVFSGEAGRTVVLALMGGLAVACLFLAGRPARLALAVGALLLAGRIDPGAAGTTLLTERSFFGIHRVTRSDSIVRLYHGTTIHGAQSLRADRRLEPLTYYRRGGPLDRLLGAVRAREVGASTTPEAARLDVGVMGLGAGAMACLGTPAEAWTFYEVDPVVVRIARNPDYFSYLSECPPRVEVVQGDARRSLREATGRRYDVLVGDAFSSDAIPVHLMTTQAVQLYMDRLGPDGVLAFHISNRYMNLEPVLAAIARELGLAARVRVETVDEEAEDRLLLGSHWVVLAREARDLGAVARSPDWRPARTDPSVEAWTDDYSSVVDVLQWRIAPGRPGRGEL